VNHVLPITISGTKLLEILAKVLGKMFRVSAMICSQFWTTTQLIVTGISN